VGQVLLVPGGWVGPQAANAVMHIVQKTSAGNYALVTCNSGSGLQYHPSEPTSAAKMKFRTCIRLENIATDRMTSPVVWSLLFTQWTKNPPSEFHRAEVCRMPL
jgi:hypothetical protein